MILFADRALLPSYGSDPRGDRHGGEEAMRDDDGD